MTAESKNLDFVAASVSAIRRDLKAANDAANFRLAELAQNLEDSGAAAAIAKLTDAITAQTKAIEALTTPSVNFTAPAIENTVNVPPQAAPTVNVQVQPTPITVEAVMPAQPGPVIHIMPAPEPKPRKWKVTIPGSGYNATDRVMTIEQLA